MSRVQRNDVVRWPKNDPTPEACTLGRSRRKASMNNKKRNDAYPEPEHSHRTVPTVSIPSKENEQALPAGKHAQG